MSRSDRDLRLDHMLLALGQSITLDGPAPQLGRLRGSSEGREKTPDDCLRGSILDVDGKSVLRTLGCLTPSNN